MQATPQRRLAPDDAALCGPDSISWRLRQRGGIVMTMAKARAALLQLAHPSIAAGIADHSSIEEDPFRRVQRTGQGVSAVLFGSPAERDASLRRLAGLHSRVNGTRADGVPYDATDPALAFFVLATLVDSDLLVEATYMRVLAPHERAAYYEEQLLAVDAFEIPRAVVPETFDGFRDYIAEQMPRLEVNDDARRVGQLVLTPRFIRAPRPVIFGYQALMADMLPANLRSGFGLNRRALALADRPVRAFARTTLPRLPRRVRLAPIRERVTR